MKLWDYGHAVNRWHTVPGGQQNLADHSWGVALIVSRYFNGSILEKIVLLAAALEHDLAEAIVGDVPRYAKSAAFEKLELDVACDLRLAHVGLPEDLTNWLYWADLIEAGLYAQHQVKLGNQYFADVVVNVSDHISGRGEKCPPELIKFARENMLCL